MKGVLRSLAGVLVLLLALAIYNADSLITGARLAYLRHLQAQQGAVDAQVRSLPHCPEITLGMSQEQIHAAVECQENNYQSAMTLLGEASAIHKKRLRLDVEWGFADGSTKDATELGWDHPRAVWNGKEWLCPQGSEPRVVEAEKEAGSEFYVHCFSGADQ